MRVEDRLQLVAFEIQKSKWSQTRHYHILLKSRVCPIIFSLSASLSCSVYPSLELLFPTTKMAESQKKVSSYEEIRLKRTQENKKRMEELKLTMLAQVVRNATSPKPSPVCLFFLLVFYMNVARIDIDDVN